MSEQPQKNPQKAILQTLLAQLSQEQLRFVAAMQTSASKKEAAERIGIQPNTVYKWPPIVDEVLTLVDADRLQAARDLAQQSLFKAMAVKVAALDNADEGIRQKAATELIEWAMGKATQRQEVAGPGGAPIPIKAYIGFSPDMWDVRPDDGDA